MLAYRPERQDSDFQKSRSAFIYIDIFYNTLMFHHLNANQNLF